MIIYNSLKHIKSYFAKRASKFNIYIYVQYFWLSELRQPEQVDPFASILPYKPTPPLYICIYTSSSSLTNLTLSTITIYSFFAFSYWM